MKKLTKGKGTGMVVKDTDCSVSNCNACAIAKNKQQNIRKVAHIKSHSLSSRRTQTYQDLQAQHLEQAIAM